MPVNAGSGSRIVLKDGERDDIYGGWNGAAKQRDREGRDEDLAYD